MFGQQGAEGYPALADPLEKQVKMRSALILAACAALAAGGYASVVGAQPVPNSPSPAHQGSGLPGSINSEDLEKLRGLLDRGRIPTAKEKARAQEEGGKLASAIALSCELTDAERVGGGKGKVGDQTVDVNVYEVACRSGTGYFLISQGPQKPIAMSCFAADATHAADIAQGVKSDLYCQLPANKDVKAMAASLLRTAGTTCAVSNFRWFGLSTTGQTEYSEVACADGKGYLLKTPQTGLTAQTSVMSCQEAAKNGLKCRLTDGGPVSAPVTMQTFHDALKQNGVSCEPAQMRLIGRETVDKRYVVEVQCPEQPRGLVAFVPLEGNTNKFETIDCAAAVERDILCKFVTK
jgi:hypothetical protein